MARQREPDFMNHEEQTTTMHGRSYATPSTKDALAPQYCVRRDARQQDYDRSRARQDRRTPSDTTQTACADCYGLARLR
jgi:hypothetical protein